MPMETAIGVIIGGIISIAASILSNVWIEVLRRPKLSLESMRAEDVQLTTVGGSSKSVSPTLKSLKIRVTNINLRGWGFGVVRAPALQAFAVLTFHKLSDGAAVFPAGMAGRWASAPAPNPIPVFAPGSGEIQLFIHDVDRLAAGTRVDIYPDESQILDVVVRFEGEDACYGWNNEAYFHTPVGKNPKWMLDHSRFLVRVVVTSSGQKCEGVFQLFNDGAASDFRLELASTDQVRKIQSRGV
jgi:hypothetical protein